MSFRLLSLLGNSRSLLSAEAHAESSHESFAMGALFFVSVVALSLFFDYTIKKYKFFYLPESAAAILLGTTIGLSVAWVGDGTAAKALQFNPELFFFLLLPPIIFEAGYTLNQGNFFKNFGTIILYAVFGTLVSTFIVGYGLYFLSVNGWCPLSKDNALESLMFGSLISATDPVATLSLMGNPTVGAPPLLYALVFGEAVLNDAVAIVLYQTFESFLDIPFTTGTVWQATVKFVYVSIGSVFVGCGVALVCAFMFKKTDFRALPHFEITLTLLFAFGSYFLAEISHLSGIMSLFFCGVVLAHYNTANISEVSRHATHDAFKSFAQICESFVFIYLGITIGISLSGQDLRIVWSPSLSFATIVLCLFARVLNTFPLTYLANTKRLHKIPFKMQLCIWFSGLRGAIAFALSIQVTTSNATVIMTSTLVVVCVTTFIFGGSTEWFLRQCDMKGLPKIEKIKLPRSAAQIAMRAQIRKLQMSALERFWFSFDNMYMKYWFGGVIEEEYSIYREPVTTEHDASASGHASDTDEDEDLAVEQALQEQQRLSASNISISNNFPDTSFNNGLKEDVDSMKNVNVEAFKFGSETN